MAEKTQRKRFIIRFFLSLLLSPLCLFESLLLSMKTLLFIKIRKNAMIFYDGGKRQKKGDTRA